METARERDLGQHTGLPVNSDDISSEVEEDTKSSSDSVLSQTDHDMKQKDVESIALDSTITGAEVGVLHAPETIASSSLTGLVKEGGEVADSDLAEGQSAQTPEVDFESLTDDGLTRTSHGEMQGGVLEAEVGQLDTPQLDTGSLIGATEEVDHDKRQEEFPYSEEGQSLPLQSGGDILTNTLLTGTEHTKVQEYSVGAELDQPYTSPVDIWFAGSGSTRSDPHQAQESLVLVGTDKGKGEKDILPTIDVNPTSMEEVAPKTATKLQQGSFSPHGEMAASNNLLTGEHSETLLSRVYTPKSPEVGRELEYPLSNEPVSKDEYIKRGFTCDITTEDEDEQLREYWTRTLESSSSTGELVEEIVKVLKHHQRTHDLLCPVCGSCVTKRVILRKRKRSGMISVDRWYPDPLEDAESELQGLSAENGQSMEEPEAESNTQEEDTEAFGCMACFSLFFKKGQSIWNWSRTDGDRESFNCLPFFFPPYPWGMTQRFFPSRPGSITAGTPSLQYSPVLGVEDVNIQQESAAEAKSDFTCGLGSALVPDYPWGIMTRHSEGATFEPSTQVEEKDDVSENIGTVGSSQFDVQSEEQEKGKLEGELPSQSIKVPAKQEDLTCGLGPALLPQYPWGYSSDHEVQKKGDIEAQKVIESKIQEKDQMSDSELEGTPNVAESKCESEVIAQEKSELADGENLTCDLMSAILPPYSWGIGGKLEEIPEDVPVLKRKRDEDDEVSFVQNGCHGLQEVASSILPQYPWGVCSGKRADHDENAEIGKQKSRREAKLRVYPDNLQVGEAREASDSECACGLGPTFFPRFPWGYTTITGTKEVKKYIEEETLIEAHIKSKTDVYTVVSKKKDYIGEKPPDDLKWHKPKKTSTLIQSITLDQTINTMDARIRIDRDSTNNLGSDSLESLPSTGFAMLDLENGGLLGQGTLTTRPSTGYALPELLAGEVGSSAKDMPEGSRERPMWQDVQFGFSKSGPFTSITSTSSAYVQEIEEVDEDIEDQMPTKIIHPLPQKVQTGTFMPWPSIGHTSSIETSTTTVQHPVQQMLDVQKGQIPDRTWTEFSSTEKPTNKGEKVGWDIPNFSWSVGKVTSDNDPRLPLKGEAIVSILKSSEDIKGSDPGKLVSVFKLSKSSDGESLLEPLLPPPRKGEPTTGESQPAGDTQRTSDAVIDVSPRDSGNVQVGTVPSTEVSVPRAKVAAGGWEILKSIVYGGLDISIASLGVTSSAAGGNAITRTVVYMGVATLLSGLIGFYHNVLNLYHHHKDHYVDVVGMTLLLHGTVALISYFVFGVLSPLIYALSFRETDNRDRKFMLCCGVTIVGVTLLSLGKAKVSHKSYLRTVAAYVFGGVLTAIIGYLTGEHVAELLESWGL